MKPRTRAIVVVAVTLEIVGVWLSAQGLIRESFIELSRETGGFSFQPRGHQPTGHQPRGAFDPDAFDPDAFAGQPSRTDRLIVGAGLALGLLPSERELTAEHRKANARTAVFGVFLVLTGMLLNAAVKARRTIWRAANYLYGLAVMLWRHLRTAGSWLRTMIKLGPR